MDPDTQINYYKKGKDYLLDPYNPDEILDRYNPDDAAILNRLQDTHSEIQFSFTWKLYSDPNDNLYYSYNEGSTYVPDYKNPDDNVIDSANNANKNLINSLNPVLVDKTVVNSYYEYYYKYIDMQTSQTYWSSDGGKTFSSDYYDFEAGKLDPVADKEIIARLTPNGATTVLSQKFPKWKDTVTGNIYYTLDYGKTFFEDITHPENIAWDSSNPAHTSTIAKFEPMFYKESGVMKYDVFEDTTDNNKQYYSFDGGQTFFDDITDPSGSTIDASDPNYATLKANLKKVDMTASVAIEYDEYIDKRYEYIKYYSSDGGNTFVKDPNNPVETVITNKDTINNLVPNCQYKTIDKTNYIYLSPDGETFYTEDKIIYKNLSGTTILDRNNPAELTIIDTFQAKQAFTTVRREEILPEVYYVYEDKQSGTLYYSPDEGETFTSAPSHPSDTSKYLDPTDQADREILNNLEPLTVKSPAPTQGGAGNGVLTISTQEAAQKALVAIDRAIVSKDAIRAHLGALQNRLENTVTNLTIQAENLQNAESRISDTDVAQEMTQFVRNQVLTQSATAMLSQANSFPHLLLSLISA